MGLLTYKHLLNLSYGFHANRKTGEVLSAIDRGKEVNRTLEVSLTPPPSPLSLTLFLNICHYAQTVLFTFIPNIIDLFASIFVITYRLDWTVAVIMVVEMSTYGQYWPRPRISPLYCLKLTLGHSYCEFGSEQVAHQKTKGLYRPRRCMSMSFHFVLSEHLKLTFRCVMQKSRTMYTDCLINYETVKYFNGEQHELDRWRETFLESQNAYMRLDGASISVFSSEKIDLTTVWTDAGCQSGGIYSAWCRR